MYGGNYQTKDGTCIRDYIHVLDLASANIKAMEYLLREKESITLNLGTGKGYSNLEVLRAVEKIVGKKITTLFKKPRLGDPDAIYADNVKAKKVLHWRPLYVSIDEIVKTAWVWEQKHPKGYRK
jgi:UDP-glucose 4-epimerase